jgi:hypothetical protein
MIFKRFPCHVSPNIPKMLQITCTWIPNLGPSRMAKAVIIHKIGAREVTRSAKWTDFQGNLTKDIIIETLAKSKVDEPLPTGCRSGSQSGIFRPDRE